MRRSFLRRHGVVLRSAAFWPAAFAVAALAGLVAFRVASSAQDAAARYGRTRLVPVAARALPTGATLRGHDVRWERRPAGLLPASPPARRPEGRVVVVPLLANEVIVDARLAPGGLRAPAALLPPGSVGLAVPLGRSSVTVAAGDRVDVLVTRDGADPPMERATTEALVVAVTRDAVTVAVDRDAAPRVAFAVSRGDVVLTLSGTTTRPRP
jgi:Flp pilus assembly protein CpaB